MNERIKISLGDITEYDCEAIVNAANTTLLGGGGVDGAIHRAAGPDLLDECRSIGGCPTGEARLTGGYRLKSSYVIHTVGPVWHGGHRNEHSLLASCYRNSLKIASENDILSIAFPAISTGVYHFPPEAAAHIAITEVKRFIEKNSKPQTVIFVLFSDDMFDLYHELLVNE